MNCPNCNTVNPDDSVFCSYCGRRLKADTGAPAQQSAGSVRYVTYQGQPSYVSQQYAAAAMKGDASKNWAAVAGVIMGICAVLIPVIRELLCVPGFVISMMGLKSEKRAAAIVGVVASGIAIIVTLVMLIALFYVYRKTGASPLPSGIFKSI